MAARPLIPLSIVVGLAASLLVASPAAAATVTVTDWAGLQAAMLVDGDTVVLGANITAPADERLQVELTESVTVNLAGRALVIASPLEDQSAVRVAETASLTIIDSVGGGSLTVTSGRNAAGIGGDEFDSAGSITIDGGTVTSSGGINGAGIGGGSAFGGVVGDGGGGMVTINGGTVIANGGQFNAAGIGGGDRGNGGVVTINGGTVTATAGLNAAGIGGGDRAHGEVVTINGGTVIANGGSSNGPGIGGGTRGGDGGTITINGGSVTALGGQGGAGIGTGARGGDGGIITITAGTIIATGGSAASGIGGGLNGGTGAALSISGGVVTATGGSDVSVGGGAGIGTGASLVADAPAVGTAQLFGTLVSSSPAPIPTSGSAAAGTDVTYVPGSDLILGITASAGRFVTVTTTNGAPDSGVGGAVVIEYAFDVMLDSANGSSPASVRVDAETPVTEPPTPTREGFEFAGWRLGSSAGAVYDFTAPVAGPIAIVAAWQPILADTGADAQFAFGAASALLVLGAFLVAAARRRRLS